ncbi:pyridoxal phosphate-dependent aminotransferase [Tetragenococcus halophilus]|uniref:MalY/PatB family protein n=1 Tax=Tetragenococcus halophilus TaxID=51669 RepID=UPI000CBEDCA4|nr:MalY/PatB family protein [Tetragenococcus halophilus]QXN87414.1 pyridoxal phosphate-dependent aminotransferase [Tetragenococcus halophilus]RQD33312.1 pyridoxal phosphate-dependent aminotransferase [Tetragenococcus halophilus subsp. halophilus DSM 20339]GBD58186.1 cystathionine beta-lyase [Tetragenococcus halophilus subsp. halophilus]GBD62519.1 cystathionine beta-lyase [Tetragenococcus halophilus subsp. halophilus]GBD73935.1 cystathionine beta-lyase [Tetragenococcus halophilus subsp. halophi
MSRFDQIVDRKKTQSVKWDTIEANYKQKDLLPMWVADMDFKAPEAVQKAFKNYLEQGVFGYSIVPDSLYEAIINWQKNRHNFTIKKEEILLNSGVVPSLALSVQAYTKPKEAVLIHDPVYPPFAQVVEENDRKLVRSKLNTDDKFTMNLEEMEKLFQKENIRLFILCNPHNPGGRVWSKEELQAVGKLCKKYNVIVVSDEIHQDIVYQPETFTTFQNADPSFKDFSIVLTAATKTFNLAGIKNSMVFIKNEKLRQAFASFQKKNCQDDINTFGVIGTQAAYEGGKDWLDDLLVYLKENINTTYNFFQNELPNVKVSKPEATYLMWLDFSAYHLTDKQLEEKFINEAKVVLNPGISYGPKGSQHMRINLACPRATLKEGLQRIATAFK